MVSSFTTNKSFEKPANGDYANTWDVPVNADMDLIDKALGGQISINVTGVSATPVTFTSTQYQALTIKFSGTLTANVTYQLPTGIGGHWIVQNSATGAFTITLSSLGAGRTVTPLASGVSIMACDGTNVDAPSGLPAGLYVDGSQNFGVGTSTPAAKVEVRKDQNANTSLYVTNVNTGLSAGAMITLATGTSNASTSSVVYDNGAAPYYVLQAGTGITANFYQAPLHYFRSTSGTEIARFDAATRSFQFGVDLLPLTGTATAANFLANTASKILSTDKVWASAAPVVITYAATTTLNFNTFINGYILLTGNVVLDTSGTGKAGQSGYIDFQQNGTGGFVVSYTAGKFASVGTTLPTIATPANNRTRLFYVIDENGRVMMTGSNTAVVYN